MLDLDRSFAAVEDSSEAFSLPFPGLVGVIVPVSSRDCLPLDFPVVRSVCSNEVRRRPNVVDGLASMGGDEWDECEASGGSRDEEGGAARDEDASAFMEGAMWNRSGTWTLFSLGEGSTAAAIRKSIPKRR